MSSDRRVPRALRQRRFRLSAPQAELISQQVEDALAASPAERMEANRTTRDLDVLIEPSLDNARRARAAVERWGGFTPDFSAEDFIAGDILSFGGLLRVEIHSRVPGAEWVEVWRRLVPGELLGVPTS